MKRYLFNKTLGFTLVEVLVAITILGIIVGFAIPKILSSGQNNTWKTSSKQAAMIITNSMQRYQYEHSTVVGMHMDDLAQYINYSQRNTTTLIDDVYGFTSFNCADASKMCLQFPDGSILMLDHTITMVGDTTLDAMVCSFDPDGRYSGSTTGRGKSVTFYLYASGRLTVLDGVTPGTRLSYTTVSDPSAYYSQIPDWFGWD